MLGAQLDGAGRAASSIALPPEYQPILPLPPRANTRGVLVSSHSA